jgi:hypothetical protein
MRDAERVGVEKRAQQLAGEQVRAAQGEAESLKKLLKEQGEAHARALAEVRVLAEKSLAPRIEEMQKALDEQDGQLKALRSREDALTAVVISNSCPILQQLMSSAVPLAAVLPIFQALACRVTCEFHQLLSNPFN